jgi:hypothetical protein
VGKLFDGYRPELHYMRGPGPKWHEKHGGAPVPAVRKRTDLPMSIWVLPAVTAALLGLAAVVALS